MPEHNRERLIDEYGRECATRADRLPGIGHRAVAAAALVATLLLPLLHSAADAADLIPFEQRYRVIATDSLRDRISSKAERTVVVEPGMTVTSISRTHDGRWLEVRLDDRLVTGFIQSRRLERITGGNTDDPLAGLARKSSGASGLSLTELTRSGEIKRRHQENEAERERQRLRAELERVEEERRRLEAEEEAGEQARAEERERLRRQAEAAGSDHSPYNTGRIDWDGVMQGLEAFTEMSNMELEQRRRQARRRQEQQRAMELEADRRTAEQRRRVEERTRELAQAEAALREQADAAERRQRQIARTMDDSSSSNANGGTTTGRGTSASSGGGGKVYEPMMETALGENTVWFAQRDLAVSYARRAAIQDISDACRARGARADRPTSDQLTNGDAPPRWSFGSPQCRQGGWEDREWSCRTEVAGTCWRRN